MADFSTLSELLAAQGERKLEKLRLSIVEEIQRLGVELGLVEDALSRKRRAKAQAATTTRPPTPEKNGAGRFEGLSREDLLRHILEMGRPVTAPEIQKHLASKGIVRKVEAVRTGALRLIKDGKLVRVEEGKYAAPRAGTKVESDDPLSRESVLDMEGAMAPDE